MTAQTVWGVANISIVDSVVTMRNPIVLRAAKGAKMIFRDDLLAPDFAKDPK